MAQSIKRCQSQVRILVLALGLFTGLALLPSSADAHARMLRSSPLAGATLSESPHRVEIWFTQELRRTSALPTLKVVNDLGDVLNPNATLDDDDRRYLYATLPPSLPTGRYAAIWNVMSDEDDDTSWGTFEFYVGQRGEVASTSATERAVTITPTNSQGRRGVSLQVLISGVSAGVLFGAIVAALIVWRRVSSP